MEGTLFKLRNNLAKILKVITIPNKFPKDVLKFKKRFTLGFDPKLQTQKQLNYLYKIKI